MKILIWLLCAMVYGLTLTVLSYCGISLGGLPTVLLAGLLLWITRTLCRRIDNKRASKSKQKEATSAAAPPADSGPEPVYYLENANGMIIQVPASRLDAWQAEQERQRKGEGLELTEIEQEIKRSIMQQIYGAKEETTSEHSDPEPERKEAVPDFVESSPQPRRSKAVPILSVCLAVVLILSIALCCIAASRISSLEAQISDLETQCAAYKNSIPSVRSASYASGYKDGYTDGEDAGRQSGYEEGYCFGYYDAALDCSNRSLAEKVLLKMIDLNDFSEVYDWLIQN